MLLQFVVFLYWIALFYPTIIVLQLCSNALCSLTPPEEHFQYLRNKSVNRVHSGTHFANRLNSFHLGIYFLLLNSIEFFVQLRWLCHHVVTQYFWVMLMRQRWSVVTGLAVQHWTISGTKPSLCLAMMKSWSEHCNDIGQWHLMSTAVTTSLHFECIVLIFSKEWNPYDGGKPYGIGHCMLSFCCYIMNMHMAQAVCVSVCADVCGCMWA